MKTAKIIAFRKAKKPRFGVIYYATVQSVSRPQKVNHTVTVTKRGAQLLLACSCESGMFRRRSRTRCRHVVSVRNRLTQISA